MSMHGDAREFLWLLGRYVAPHWRVVILLLITTYIAAGAGAALPLVMAPILDLVLGSAGVAARAPGTVTWSTLSLHNLGAAFFQWTGVSAIDDRFKAIAILCLVYVAIGAVKAAMDFVNYLIALWIRVRGAATMQQDVFRHLLGLSLGFFTKGRTGELVSRLDGDTRAATAGLETIIGTLMTAPVLVLVYGYLLVRTSPRLVVAAGGAVALHYGLTRLVRGPIRRFATDQFTAFAEVVTRLQETILSIRVVKSFGAEAFELRRLAQALREVIRVNVKFGLYKHAEQPARTFVSHVIETAILALGAWELLAGHLTASAFFLFLYVGRAVMAQIALLGAAYTQMHTTLAASNRIVELLALRPEVQDGPETIGNFEHRIVVDDVSFDYGGEPVLRGVKLVIEKGEMVALVGPSGAGKSTLADLILRLYDPVSGVITVDGRDLRTLTQASYRRLFGVVSQEALLFNASIRNNIAYGRDGVSESEIVRAAKIANAHEFIIELPDGYATVVGDRGIRLSGGQRQRVAIARAIVTRPPILILDEATSALDTESERLVQQAIERVIHDTTSIVIAHRLSTVRHADKIVVLARGAVEAVGRHSDLLTTNETYARLYRLQFEEAALGRV